MSHHDQLKALIIECFTVRRPELKPGVEYTAKRILKPIWAELEPWEQRLAGNIFYRLVESGEMPMECLGESRRTGHSLIYRLV